MSLATRRHPDELRTGVEAWLGRAVATIDHPDPGWSCETVIVDRETVIRLPPLGDGTFPVYDLEQQASVTQAVADAGIPTAAPVRYEPDTSFFGAPFVTMPFVEGPIPGQFTPADPWLIGLPGDDDRRGVWSRFVSTLVAIHRVPTEELGLRTGLDTELDWWSDYLRWATDGTPPAALADAFSWCKAHRPVGQPSDGLLWGDVRFGNVIFDPETFLPRAVLDWDMVSVGPFEADLAWFLALEGVTADLSGMTVPGFGTHEETVAFAEAELGRDLEHLDWYEVFALVRASAISTRIAVLFERAGERSMFRVGEDPTLAAAVERIDAW